MAGQGHYFKKCTFKANYAKHYINFKQFLTQVCKIRMLPLKRYIYSKRKQTRSALNQRWHHDIQIKKDKLLQKQKTIMTSFYDKT